MPYILDENGDYALDKNGNKLECTVEYINDENSITKGKLDKAINNVQQQITLLQNQIKNSGNR